MTKLLPPALQVFSVLIFCLAVWAFIAIGVPLISLGMWLGVLLVGVFAIGVVVIGSSYPWFSNLIFGAYSTVCAAHLLALCVFLHWNSFSGGEVSLVAQYYYFSSGVIAIGHVITGVLGLMFMVLIGDKALASRAKATAVGMAPTTLLVAAAAFVCAHDAPFDPAKTSGVVREFLDGGFVRVLDFSGYLTHRPLVGRVLFSHWIVWLFGLLSPVCLFGWFFWGRPGDSEGA